MIPREILKKIRPNERRTNRIVTEAAAACARLRISAGFRPEAIRQTNDGADISSQLC